MVQTLSSSRTRRSGRVVLELPIMVAGTDVNSHVFCKKGIARNFSHYGAELRLDSALMPDQELNVFVPATEQDQAARVVEMSGNGSEGYTYGIEFLDPVEGFWDVPVPAHLPERPAPAEDIKKCPPVDTASSTDGQGVVRTGAVLREKTLSLSSPVNDGIRSKPSVQEPEPAPEPLQQSEERFYRSLRVRVRGLDRNGNRFSQSTYTVEISRNGGRIVGLGEVTTPGSIIQISHLFRRAQFRVIWVGQPGTCQASLIGVQCLEPEKNLWGLS